MGTYQKLGMYYDKAEEERPNWGLYTPVTSPPNIFQVFKLYKSAGQYQLALCFEMGQVRKVLASQPFHKYSARYTFCSGRSRCLTILMSELMHESCWPSQAVTVTVELAVPLKAIEGMLIGMTASADIPALIGQATPKVPV